jgi:chemotaxis protein MotB
LEVLRERDRLRTELTASRDAGAKLGADLSAARLEQNRLAAALVSESASLVQLRKESGELKSDCDRLRAELESERAARAQEAARLGVEAEALRSSTAALEAQAALLAEEKKRTEEEKSRKLEEMTRTYEGLLKGMKAEVEKGEITISQLRDRLTVNLLDEILFDSGSAKVKARGTDVLKRVGEALKEVEDKAIVIEGHTDNVALKEELTRQFPTNWELSTARATSVVRYLQDRVGIDPTRLSAVGFGPHRPVDTNDTPEGRARNRRIEIKLMPLEAALIAPPAEKAQGPKP